MVGRTAHELVLRRALDEWGANKQIAVPTAAVRGILHDLDLWHEIVENEIDKWSFDALVAMAKRILDARYPESVFIMPLTDVAIAKYADSGDTGVIVVTLLRKVIEEIERDHTPTKAAQPCRSVSGDDRQ